MINVRSDVDAPCDALAGDAVARLGKRANRDLVHFTDGALKCAISSLVASAANASAGPRVSWSI